MPTTYNVAPAYPLYIMWPLLVSLVSAVYGRKLHHSTFLYIMCSSIITYSPCSSPILEAPQDIRDAAQFKQLGDAKEPLHTIDVALLH